MHTRHPSQDPRILVNGTCSCWDPLVSSCNRLGSSAGAHVPGAPSSNKGVGYQSICTARSHLELQLDFSWLFRYQLQPHEQHRALHAWQAAGSHPTKHHSLTNSIPARDAQGCEVSLGTGCRHFNCSQSNDSIQFVCTKDPSLASAAFSAVFSGVFSDASV